MKKFLSVLSFLIIISQICFGVSAEPEGADIDCAESSFEFAVKAAEFVKSDPDGSMLRIIGKLRCEESGVDFSLASDYVVSDDGRFILQFECEEELA